MSGSWIWKGMLEQMKGMQKSDKCSVQIEVKHGCKMLVRECEKSPNWEMCTAIKKMFAVNDKQHSH